MLRLFRISATIALFLLVIYYVGGASNIPTINSILTDNSRILEPQTKLELETKLNALEKSTNGVQFVIYIEDSYPKDYSLEEYVLQIAEKNQIGKSGNDNGILLYVAVRDREFRWETGYGAESVLPASLLGRISRDKLVPNFKLGNFEKGILETVKAVEGIIKNSQDPDILRLKGTGNSFPISQKYYNLIIIMVFLIVWITIFIISSRGKNKSLRKYSDDFFKGAATGIFLSGFGKGRFGGGSSGGFSGGGGSFGGGGFSGKW